MAMKEVFILRHGEWDLEIDRLTYDGARRALEIAEELPPFSVVYSSPLNRNQQTARLLGKMEPKLSDLADSPKVPLSLRGRINERCQTHRQGIAGAMFEISEVIPKLQVAGGALKQLIERALNELKDGQFGLIVSHDETMVAAELIIQAVPLNTPPDHTYRELEGYQVDQNLSLAQHRYPMVFEPY